MVRNEGSMAFCKCSAAYTDAITMSTLPSSVHMYTATKLSYPKPRKASVCWCHSDYEWNSVTAYRDRRWYNKRKPASLIWTWAGSHLLHKHHERTCQGTSSLQQSPSWPSGWWVCNSFYMHWWPFKRSTSAKWTDLTVNCTLNNEVTSKQSKLQHQL